MFLTPYFRFAPMSSRVNSLAPCRTLKHDTPHHLSCKTLGYSREPISRDVFQSDGNQRDMTEVFVIGGQLEVIGLRCSWETDWRILCRALNELDRAQNQNKTYNSTGQRIFSTLTTWFSQATKQSLVSWIISLWLVDGYITWLLTYSTELSRSGVREISAINQLLNEQLVIMS